MLIIAENDMKLLKMKEKLLSISSDDNIEAALNDYKKMAAEIDSKLFAVVSSDIKSHKSYTDLPLENQLEVLKSLQKAYDEYYQFRSNIENICQKYDGSIRLSDVSSINIEEIRKRISSIQKYFANKRSIERAKEELDKMNGELINEDKKTNLFMERIASLDEELRQSILKKIYNTYNVDEIEYTDVIIEGKNLGIDVEAIINDEEALKEALENAKKELDEANERLNTAKICYDKSPNDNYRDIYLSIRKETINIKYKLIFLKIIDLINKNDNTYEGAKAKREELKQLIRSKTELLKQLDININDTFDRLKINKQLEIINSYGDNSVKIRQIVDRIKELNAEIDSKTEENRNFVEYFGTYVELIADHTALSTILDREEVDTPDIKPIKKKQNQIIKISDIPKGFKFDRTQEKTDEVLKRVHEMMTTTPTESNNVSTGHSVNPKLVIASGEGETKPKEDDIFLDLPFEEEKKEEDDIFLDLPFEEETPAEEAKEDDVLFLDLPPEASEPKKEAPKEDDVFLDLPFEVDDDLASEDDITDDDNVEITKVDNPQVLFQEIKPFDDITLFDDRSDDGTIFKDDSNLKLDLKEAPKEDTTLIQNVKSPQEPAPAAPTVEPPIGEFWTTKDEPQGESKIIPLDDSQKVKKLVA